jgi:hypothetical protein
MSNGFQKWCECLSGIRRALPGFTRFRLGNRAAHTDSALSGSVLGQKFPLERIEQPHQQIGKRGGAMWSISDLLVGW